MTLRLRSNSARIRPATSVIMPLPRPYCATEPDSSSRVVTATAVPPAAGSSAKLNSELTAPRPLGSLPEPRSRRCARRRPGATARPAVEGELDRSQPQRHGTAVLAVARVPGQPRARQAGQDARHVQHEHPCVLQRQGHMKPIRELHQQSPGIEPRPWSIKARRRIGVSGNSAIRTPWARRASSTAPITAAATGTVAHSPMPLTPRGLSVVGDGWNSTSMRAAPAPSATGTRRRSW